MQYADPFVLVEGPRGTGKTRAILSLLVQRAIQSPGRRILLARSTRTRLSGSVLLTLEQQVLPAFGMSVPGAAGRDNRSEYQLPGGSALVPMGLDDFQRSQSAEYSDIYVAEGVEIPEKDTVVSLAGSLRQAGQEGRQIIVDCNPGPPAHWLNRIAEDVPHIRVDRPADYRVIQRHNRADPAAGRWKRIITRHQDNPAYFDVPAWQWTAAGNKYLETLGHLSGHLRRRWLDGEWVAAEGTVYPEFDVQRHVMQPFAVPADWPCAVGLDPGYDHPCAILWLAVAPNGCYYVIDELYRGGLGIPRHAADIKARNAGRTVHRYYADPQHAFSHTAQSPKSIAQQLRECGLSFSPWPRSTNVEAMVEAVRERLRSDRLKVFATCQNTINEFQSWSYKRNSKGETPAGDDQFEDRDNHAMDVIKGLCAAPLDHQGRGVQVIY